MPLGQGWLNAWVKVNSKHVVFPPSQSSVSSHSDQRNVQDGTANSSNADQSDSGHRRQSQFNAPATPPSSSSATHSTSSSLAHVTTPRRLSGRKMRRLQQRRFSTAASRRKGRIKESRASISATGTRNQKSLSLGSTDDLMWNQTDHTGESALQSLSQDMMEEDDHDHDHDIDDNDDNDDVVHINDSHNKNQDVVRNEAAATFRQPQESQQQKMREQQKQHQQYEAQEPKRQQRHSQDRQQQKKQQQPLQQQPQRQRQGKQSRQNAPPVPNEESSLSFVTGFFGANIDQHHSTARLGQANKNARPNHASQNQRIAGSSSSVASRGVNSEPSRVRQARADGRTQQSGKKTESSFLSPKSGSRLSLRFPFVDAPAPCMKCEKLEHDLEQSREDLEVVRNLALQYEASLRDSHDAAASGAASEDSTNTSFTPITSAPASLSLAQQSEAAAPPSSSSIKPMMPMMPVVATTESAQVVESNDDQQDHIQMMTLQMARMAAEHKREIQALTAEKMRWQQEMQPKLQQYSTLCKELDEEASMRNEEVIGLHDELEKVQLERDMLATDNEKLKFRVQQLETHQSDNILLKAKLEQYEDCGIDHADKSIRQRDSVIAELMMRLQTMMKTIHTERDQHLQRRQIIFSNVNVTESMEVDLRKTRASLREAEATMEQMKLDHHRKELEWIRQVERLQRRSEGPSSEMESDG